ncbi:MAG: hypothetical protein M3R07_04985, partial [Gemmatimonadota bacterium]|nr:hypothetical protein [Gemmatimonadota bacterium]
LPDVRSSISEGMQALYMERSLRVRVTMRNIPGTLRTSSRPMGILCFAAIGLIGATAACTTATPSTDLDFVTHASFFSGEMGANPAVDPHAFVADSGQPAATGRRTSGRTMAPSGAPSA